MHLIARYNGWHSREQQQWFRNEQMQVSDVRMYVPLGARVIVQEDCVRQSHAVGGIRNSKHCHAQWLIATTRTHTACLTNRQVSSIMITNNDLYIIRHKYPRV